MADTQKLQLVFDSKAEKQFAVLGEETQQQIMHDIACDMGLYEKNGASGGLRGFGNIYTGAFWAVQSHPYRILVRVEHDKHRVLVMDIGRR